MTTLLSLLLALPLLICGCTGDEMPEDAFTMTAKITEIGERIEVEVTESENEMTGPFWLITSEDTVYTTAAGKTIGRRDLRVGDVITVYYGGQVMMSYPPQVVAVGILKR